MWYNISKQNNNLVMSYKGNYGELLTLLFWFESKHDRKNSNSPGVLWCNTDSMLSYTVRIEYVLRS